MGPIAVCAIAAAVAFVGSIPIAGPVAVLTLARAAVGRFGDALRVGLGAAVAEGIYAGVAFWGFATFLARWRLVTPISRAASGILLITLGVRFVFWRPAKAETREDHRAGTALLGFSISALNPTLLVTWSAIVAFLYSRGLDRASPVLAIPFGLSAGAGVATWFVSLVSLLRSFRRRLPQAAFRWAIRTAGLALIVLGIAAAVKFVQWMTHPGARAEVNGARSGQANFHDRDRGRTNRTILAG